MSRARIVTFAGVLSLALVAAPAWAALKVGVVNYTELLRESPQAKVAQRELQHEFGARQQALKREQDKLTAEQATLQKNAATMTADQRTQAEEQLRDGKQDLSQKVSDYQDDFNTRQNQELSRIQASLVKEVQKYAAARNFDLVLASGVIYANPALDITAGVLRQLQSDASQATAGDAPGRRKR